MGGSAPRRDHHLPAETTSFVDRRGELTQGRELLARARLVTLTGPGGVGKTRLAARIAARVQRAFPDGVRFVHLSGLHDPALVPLAAADALGLQDRSAQPALDALVEQVRDRRLLLVVDNCEHLAAACARLAAALLHGTEGVRILATSRHRLGLTEEHLLEVRPLPVPDPHADLSAAAGYPALTLFADRAAAVVPGFRLTPANRASVARLCHRLDGLPLAIELAAVRMRVLDVDQLLDRLDDRYRFLTTGSPAALPRHQTLRAAVAWSHDLCTLPEQTVWARLSVLAGGFDLETAEAVCADTTPETTARPPEGGGDLPPAAPLPTLPARPSEGSGADARGGGGSGGGAWPTGGSGADARGGGGSGAGTWPTGGSGAGGWFGDGADAGGWPADGSGVCVRPTGGSGVHIRPTGGSGVGLRVGDGSGASGEPPDGRPGTRVRPIGGPGAQPVDGPDARTQPADNPSARFQPADNPGARLHSAAEHTGSPLTLLSPPGPRTDDVLEAVAGLVDKSVLCREPGPGGVRYRLLDTLRQYGLEQLRRIAGEEEAARRRQRDWMLRRAEACERGWFGPGQPETVARLRADRDNLRAALDFSLSTPGEALAGLRLAGTLWFYWHACGASREGLYWLDRALAAAPEPTRERARGLWVAGLLAAATRDFPRGHRHAAEALALARALGDAAEAAHAEYVIGVIRLFGDDLPGALRHFETTVARGPVPGRHLSLVGLDQVELACALAFLGEAERAVEVCEQALGLCERHGEKWVRSYVLRILALAHSVRGDWPRAERHGREALRLKLAVHDVIGIALTLDLLASIAAERGAHEHAALLLGGADRAWADIDTGRWGSHTLNSARRASEERSASALGRDAFERAHRRGHALGLAELVGHACQEPGRPHPAEATAVPPPHDGTSVRLTRRETEVARLVAEGLANQQIADRLVIARRTAEGHVERILSKLGFRNRSQIAAWMTAQR
ncbi:putative ATPase/DNA-binding CsgD family transcriptional regulator [Streptomyces luteogriseus]|uniref:Putative ATPase/DNA-binding CsgD family transcriptional regulator n=1 Tax=Streptomyces luteogriseus TaxID=68233 RepID=A0A7W7DM10_9ACTN|nr:LuxR C-terminal-related transcriptional regulator [Streptomyces luteogriseus]MBB4712918.1 putative ATPase/DNA-binding CsgD family transcriptional regulator [Streptomyces luteogriseus]